MLVEVNPNTSNAIIESAKQNLKATNSTLQFSSAYTYQGKRGYPTNQISLSLKPNTSITQINALFGNQYVSATLSQILFFTFAKTNTFLTFALGKIQSPQFR